MKKSFIFLIAVILLFGCSTGNKELPYVKDVSEVTIEERVSTDRGLVNRSFESTPLLIGEQNKRMYAISLEYICDSEDFMCWYLSMNTYSPKTYVYWGKGTSSVTGAWLTFVSENGLSSDYEIGSNSNFINEISPMKTGKWYKSFGTASIDEEDLLTLMNRDVSRIGIMNISQLFMDIGDSETIPFYLRTAYRMIKNAAAQPPKPEVEYKGH